MSQASKTFRGIPQTTWRRLRNTPTYFFIIWRWATWLYALAIIIATGAPLQFAFLPLLISFIQSFIVTLYTPVFRTFLPDLPLRLRPIGERQQPGSTRPKRMLWNRNLPQPLAADEEATVEISLANTPNRSWDIALYGLDVVICGLVTYFGAINTVPPFGDGSPFYRYGLSTVLVAAFAYRYWGGLLAAFGYEAIVLVGAFLPPPGAQLPYTPNAVDLLGSFIDAPLVAIVAGYIASLLNSYTIAKRREQDNVRKQRALRSVSDTLVSGASDRQRLLQKSVEQIRKGGHFERLVIALISSHVEQEDDNHPQVEIDTLIESGEIDIGQQSLEQSNQLQVSLLRQVAQSGEKLVTFEPLKQAEPYGIARIYLPFSSKEGQVSMVVGSESIRKTPFEEKYEEFLLIVGPQLVVALENILLAEQAAELAERGRLARELHDGVAQNIYMLSLNTETCLALAQRIAGTSAEEAERIAPLSERLDKLVTIAKQALWETRHYMFQLRPLISGSTTLTQILTNQLREFEAISGLSTRLEVEGTEEGSNGEQQYARKAAQARIAIFRITQEALTNAFKHGGATQIHVHLRHLPHSVEIEISDNGRGMQAAAHSYDLDADDQAQPIYSGRGMRGMRERAEELGGTFEVTQAATGGVYVRAHIPA
jgi:signal transduction histidine kinase